MPHPYTPLPSHRRDQPRRWRWAGPLVASLWMAACGGGGGDPGTCYGGVAVCNPGVGTSPAPAAPSADGFLDPPYAPSSTLEQSCDADGAKRFVRSYLDEVYLWYREIPRLNRLAYSDAPAYFNALVLPAPKDRFSAVISQADADALATGDNTGYGLRWTRDVLGRTRLAAVTPESPADLAGMARGGELVEVLDTNVNSWTPNQAGAWIRLRYRDTPTAPIREIRLDAAPLNDPAVPLVTTVTSPQGTRSAYLLFSSHTQGAQDALIQAVTDLKTQPVSELVLDLRYNPGGFLYVAQTLASMLSAPDKDGQVFERLQFNDKRTDLSNEAVYRFGPNVLYGETRYPTGHPLPRLGLPRVYVLTTGGSCSASEALINGLRGVDVEVVLIGQTTCGKPYGFTRKDQCGQAYFPIEFQGVNAKGEGDYASGFAPTCSQVDDLDRALGQPDEGLLATALHHIDTRQCLATARQSAATPAASAPQRLLLDDLVARQPGKVHRAAPR